MKEIMTFTIPVRWSGKRPNLHEEFEKQRQSLREAIRSGFKVTHITSSTVNDVMYAYHFLEKEEK